MNKKIDIRDVAILIIVKLDSIDRLENVLSVTKYITTYFDANIHVWEFGSHNNLFLQTLLPRSVQYKYYEDFDPVLYRTKYINDMLRSVDSKYVSIWDADVIVPIKQVEQSISLLNEGIDFVYPYEHLFYETSPCLRKIFVETNNIDVLLTHTQFMNILYSPNPVGGVFFANRESYLQSGGETELFYGWGMEDGERFNRWMINKRKIHRVKGCIFHLTHSRGLNSCISSNNDDISKKRVFNSTHKMI